MFFMGLNVQDGVFMVCHDGVYGIDPALDWMACSNETFRCFRFDRFFSHGY